MIKVHHVHNISRYSSRLKTLILYLQTLTYCTIPEFEINIDIWIIKLLSLIINIYEYE